MLAALGETSRLSYWDEWEQIRCPTLIVRAAGGEGCRRHYERMTGLLPGSRLVEIPDAGHDVHLDQPGRWRAAVEEFLAG
jgi:pimeloyl-ACP methyl ester carboxylesterase